MDRGGDMELVKASDGVLFAYGHASSGSNLARPTTSRRLPHYTLLLPDGVEILVFHVRMYQCGPIECETPCYLESAARPQHRGPETKPRRG